MGRPRDLIRVYVDNRILIEQFATSLVMYRLAHLKKITCNCKTSLLTSGLYFRVRDAEARLE